MSQIRLQMFLACLVLGGTLMSPPALQADEGMIPSSLSKEKKEKLSKFLAQVKGDKKGGFIPAGAKLRSLVGNVALDFNVAADDEVKEYLAAIIPHRAVGEAKESNKADVYWYRPNPKSKSPGVTIKRVVDLDTGKAVAGSTEALIGYPAPLTREERAQAIELAKAKVDAAKKLLDAKDKDVVLEVLFETLTAESANGKPGDRVVSLRIRKKGEKSVVAVNVNLTKQTVRQPE